MYSQYAISPRDREAFVKILPEVTRNKQILLHIFPEGGVWRFHLGAYTLSDWPDPCEHEDFYEFFRGVYGLDGGWGNFLQFYQSRILDLENLDIRIQPMGRIHFGILQVENQLEEEETVLDFLKQTLGREHRGFQRWMSLGPGTKRYLVKKTIDSPRDTAHWLRWLDQMDTQSPFYVMTKGRGKHDLLGGHTMLAEFVAAYRVADCQKNWQTILDRANEKAFYREVAEELGLEPLAIPAGTGEGVSDFYRPYRGIYSPGEVWLRFVWEAGGTWEGPIRIGIRMRLPKKVA